MMRQPASNSTTTTTTVVLTCPLLPPPPPPPAPPAAWKRERRSCVCSPLSCGLRRLGSACEVPEYQRRPYILEFYRLQTPQFSHLFDVHNETLNVWTHLLGAAYFVSRGHAWVTQQWHGAQFPGAVVAASDRDFREHLKYPLVYFVLVGLTPVASALCMMASALFHWRSCSEPREFQRCLCMDRAFVLVLILVSVTTGTLIFFTCSPHLQLGYLTMSLLVCAAMLACMVVPALHKFQALTLKAAVLEVAPIAHWFCTFENTTLKSLWPGVVFTGVLYVFGLFFLVSHVPERWHPGRFDLVGQSHQIWHLAVFFGAALWMETIFLGFDRLRYDSSVCLA